MIKIKKDEIENEEFKEASDIMESIKGTINIATGMSNDKKELAIREWLTINMATIRDETNVYSIDDIIERLNSVMKLERALDKACEELVKMSYCKDCYEFQKNGCPFINGKIKCNGECHDFNSWKKELLK